MAEGFHYFTSADSGAPALTGENGSLIDVMDWLITLPPDTATAGDNQWVKEFTGTNKAVYRAKKGNRLYLRIQDDGPTAQVAREAGVRFFETMTDVDTGSVQAPTGTQESGLGQPWVWRKSNTASAVVRPYFGIITARNITLVIESVAGFHQHMAFGDAASCSPSTDSYNSFMLGRSGNNGNDGNATTGGAWATNYTAGVFTSAVAVAWANVTSFIWRSRSGSGSSIPGHLIDFSLNSGVPSYSGDLGGVQIVPAYIQQRNADGALAISNADRGPRLFVPFVQQIVTAAGTVDGDTFSLGSRNFRVWLPAGTANTNVKALEISNTDPVQP